MNKNNQKHIEHRANGLQSIGNSKFSMDVQRILDRAPNPTTITVPTLTSTYQNDYRPIECRWKCEKIEEPTGKEKWSIINCLCKCGKKSYTPKDPRVFNSRISEYKDNVSRIGRVIMKANLHDHSKCAPSCTHIYVLE